GDRPDPAVGPKVDGHAPAEDRQPGIDLLELEVIAIRMAVGRVLDENELTFGAVQAEQTFVALEERQRGAPPVAARWDGCRPLAIDHRDFATRVGVIAGHLGMPLESGQGLLLNDSEGRASGSRGRRNAREAEGGRQAEENDGARHGITSPLERPGARSPAPGP